MTKQIGRSFGEELIAAGLNELPISWTSAGEFTGREELTAEQNSALDAVIAAHDAGTWDIQQHERRERRRAFAADNGVKQLNEWIATASSRDIDDWIDKVDPKVVLKILVKALAAR